MAGHSTEKNRRTAQVSGMNQNLPSLWWKRSSDFIVGGSSTNSQLDNNNGRRRILHNVCRVVAALVSCRGGDMMNRHSNER